jgi:hypothetical protein
MNRTKLNERIKAYCERAGMTFKPWEVPPWDVDDEGPSPWPEGSAGSATWPKAQALRVQIIEALGE